MIVKVKIETFWFSTYSMEMHYLTSSSFIICLWGETFGSRTILFAALTYFEKKYEFIRYGFSLVWVLVLILILAILEQSINNKMVSKI